MKRFRFSLETLLSLRREKEQEREIALAAATGRLVDIDRRIAAARAVGERAFSEIDGDLDALRLREALWAKSVNDQRALQEPRRDAASDLEAAREAYAEAHSERAALDRLKQRRREQWKKQVRRDEIRSLDEAAKGTAARKRLTGGDL